MSIWLTFFALPCTRHPVLSVLYAYSDRAIRVARGFRVVRIGSLARGSSIDSVRDEFDDAVDQRRLSTRGR